MQATFGMTSKHGENWWILRARGKVVRFFVLKLPLTFKVLRQPLTVEDRAIRIKNEYIAFKDGLLK